jgi:hypothetical protein
VSRGEWMLLALVAVPVVVFAITLLVMLLW